MPNIPFIQQISLLPDFLFPGGLSEQPELDKHH
ncbi:hypothetical protein EPYR_01031 [Erwinia pyrifoliae DSM 12163]|nr:hypothetical protein EPYR_01031 [Erwinia pyrifoliae DSM 12163]